MRGALWLVGEAWCGLKGKPMKHVNFGHQYNGIAGFMMTGHIKMRNTSNSKLLQYLRPARPAPARKPLRLWEQGLW
jgi:hypothetical protein